MLNDKFSKKLVSKCIYILILKNTKTELLDTFMAEGGWTLIQTWLQDAVHTSNRHLVKEIIGLLLITPVDVERLKTNILPKLIKSLSRRDDLEDVAELSTELVKHWLVIVKGSSSNAQGQPQPEKMDLSEADSTNTNLKDESSDRISPNTFYKKDGQTGKASPKKEGSDDSSKEEEDVEMKDVSKEKSKSKEEKVDKEDKVKSSSRSSRSTSSKDKDKGRDKDRYRDKDKSKSSSSSSKSSSSKSKSSSSSSRDKDRKDKDREREKDKSRQRDKSRDKDKDKRDKEKDKQRSNGAIKSNSSSSKEKKEEKKDKDKSEPNVFNLVKTPSIDKLGRIPKNQIASLSILNLKTLLTPMKLKRRPSLLVLKRMQLPKRDQKQ
ncbi:unnamed protein product [Diabrotica balteata]|uniref:TFIIS N-terminal domain-containing protein n=1 Tax=Diabrotica balteata TaxID=107213 RepID=A0A9N9X642_DIABA|nr:unnamed protein product [Diabrotica balteata]